MGSVLKSCRSSFSGTNGKVDSGRDLEMVRRNVKLLASSFNMFCKEKVAGLRSSVLLEKQSIREICVLKVRENGRRIGRENMWH